MLSVIMARKAAISARSQAACKLMKFCLAADTKPCTSKSAGMNQFWLPPIKEEPIRTPGRVGVLSKFVPFCSHGRAEASLPILAGLYCGMLPGLVDEPVLP